MAAKQQNNSQKKPRGKGKPFKAGGVVVDPFVGSGTTLIACENLKYKARAIEISPAYCAVTLERFYQHTNIMPKLVKK